MPDFLGSFQDLGFDSPPSEYCCSKWGAVTSVAALIPSEVWECGNIGLVAYFLEGEKASEKGWDL